MGVGFIVGFRVSAILFSGSIMGWLVFVPLAMFLNPAWADQQSSELATQVWLRQIRPLAVGTMIVAAFYTLYNLRTSLIAGISKELEDEGATMEQIDRVGRKEFAYENHAKQNHGYYVNYLFEAAPAAIDKIQTRLALSKDIQLQYYQAK